MVSNKNKLITVKVQKYTYDYLAQFQKLYGISISALCNHLIIKGILDCDKAAEKNNNFYTELCEVLKKYDLRRK